MTITIGYTADLDSRGTRASAVLWLFVEQIESAEDVHEMMRSCWEMNAVRRPSFSQLVQWLRRRLRPVMRDSLISSTRSIIDQRQSTPCDRCVTLNQLTLKIDGYIDEFIFNRTLARMREIGCSCHQDTFKLHCVSKQPDRYV